MLVHILEFIVTTCLLFWGAGVLGILFVTLDKTPSNGTSGGLGLMMISGLMACIAGGLAGFFALLLRLAM